MCLSYECITVYLIIYIKLYDLWKVCVWYLWMQVWFVEWRGSSWSERWNQGSNVIQRKRTGQFYFQQLDHNIIRKIKLGEIDSLFIHLSWVNEEDNSGGLSSLSRIKTQLNRWWLCWGRFILFLSNWISDPIVSLAFSVVWVLDLLNITFATLVTESYSLICP